MPELPEVENLRIALEGKILGQKILKVTVKRPKLVSGKGNLRIASRAKAAAFKKGLEGERFAAILRRAKNLIFKTVSGKIVLVHLKMSGQFLYQGHNSKNITVGGHPIELSETAPLPNKHTHIIFELEKGTLYFNDIRMFGYLLFYPNESAFEKENHFLSLGLEPLDPQFTAAYLKNALRSKKGTLKSLLMGQKIVVGLGNIYADEAAFEAGIRPTRQVSTLSGVEIARLHKAIKRILKRAVRLGGSSVATYRLLDDSRGNYAREHKVYGKSGKNCPVCRRLLVKTIVQSRTTVYCPHCQI